MSNLRAPHRGHKIHRRSLGWFAFGVLAAASAYSVTPIRGPLALTEIPIYLNRPVLPFIIRLKPEYRAIAAKVSGEFNSGCHDGHCDLTDALELGEQCSEKHVSAIRGAFGTEAAHHCRYVPETGKESARLRNFVLRPSPDGAVHADIKYDQTIGEEHNCFTQRRDYTIAGTVISETGLPSVSCTPTPIPLVRMWDRVKNALLG